MTAERVAYEGSTSYRLDYGDFSFLVWPSAGTFVYQVFLREGMDFVYGHHGFYSNIQNAMEACLLTFLHGLERERMSEGLLYRYDRTRKILEDHQGTLMDMIGVPQCEECEGG